MGFLSWKLRHRKAISLIFHSSSITLANWKSTQSNDNRSRDQLFKAILRSLPPHITGQQFIALPTRLVESDQKAIFQKLRSGTLTPRATSIMSSPTDTTCENCADLDLRGIFRGNFEMEDGFISRRSDTSVRWAWQRTEHCTFCHFIQKCSAFRTIVYDPPELDAQLEPRWLKHEKFKWFELENGEVILRLVFNTPPSEESLLEHSRSWNQLPHSLIGCTVSDDCPGVEARGGSIQVIPQYLSSGHSYDALAKRIKTCQERHSGDQEDGDNQPPLSIPNLLLIDCVNRQVVAAPHRCWYLALSYVWGNQRPRAVEVGEILCSLPQTIEDAITVTLKLGFQYLWVDMYCIKQDNQNHVGDQIRHMDLVYRTAQATIIAAAGDNPEFGLPGVSTSRHPRQASATVNGVSVANFTHNPWELVDSSVWNSRAWTFQESLFSPRRIFFTTEQTIYNCSCGWNCEGIEPTQPRTLNSDNRYRIRNWMVRQAPSTFSNHYSPSTIYLLIRQYSQRQLSFSNDVLNAFSGVLHAYDNLSLPVRNLWGIPILSQETSVLESFNIGMSWNFSSTKAPTSLNRRGDFPSWSWTGWEYPVFYKSWYTSRMEYSALHELNAAIEINDGSKVSWMDIKQAIVNGQQNLCNLRFLRLEAWTTPVVLDFSMEGSEGRSAPISPVYATIGPEGHSNKFRAQVPSLRNCAGLERLEQYKNAYMCTGILLGGFKKNDTKLMEHPLLLVVKKGQFWERLGITYLKESSKLEHLCVDPLCVDPLCSDPPCDRPWCDLDHNNKGMKRTLVSEWVRNELPLSREVMYLG